MALIPDRDKIICDVLIVDDSEFNLMYVSELIESEIINPVTCSNGKDALKLAIERDFALILLDVQMPGLDGFEVLKRLRKMENQKYTPVIFISALKSNNTLYEKVISFGGIDFISKPVNPKILLGKVKLLCHLYQNHRYSIDLIDRLELNKKRLETSESRFRKIAYTANDAIIVTDNTFKINFWNRAAKDIFGYTKYEAINEKISEIIIAEKDIEQFKQLEQIESKSVSNRYDVIELTGKNKLGIEFPIEISASAFASKTEPLSYVLIIRNIAVRKQIEKEKLKSKELREANKTMKEFIDNVSHELRTPMNAILGISKMLLKYKSDNLTKKQLEGLTIISQSGDRLIDLINDVLDVSRIESNRLIVKNESFNIDNMLSHIKSTAQNLITSKELKIVIKRSSRIPQIIYCDQNKVIQILTNLIGNSIKFTNKGKITLCVHLIDNKLTFEVADTGVGISKERIHSIFKKFQQVDNSETKKFKGTGLGLYLTKKLVELLEGEISVESEVGKGTVMRFYITLPQETTPVEDEVIKSDLDFTDINIFNTQEINKIAIIIDNHKDNRFIFKNILQDKGFACLFCSSIKEGTLAIEDFLPNLVFFRLELPGLQLKHFINKFKNSPIIQNFIAFTSHIENKTLNIGNIPLLLEPLNSAIINTNIKNLSRAVKKPIYDIVVLYEDKSWLKDIYPNKKGFFYFSDKNPDLLLIKLLRRNVETLIIENFHSGDNGLKLFLKLSEGDYLKCFRRVLLHSDSEPFKYIKENIVKHTNVFVHDKETLKSILFK